MKKSTPAKAETGKNGGGISNKHVALILGTLLIVAAAIVIIVILTRPQPPVVSDNAIPVVDENNVEKVQNDVEEKVAKGMFETDMNTTWKFPDGKTASTNAIMGNSANNNYPFWFEVVLKDTSEVVYTSSLLPVGTRVKEIVLSKPLEKGSYPASVRIHMVDENNEPLDSNVGFSITLSVEQ